MRSYNEQLRELRDDMVRYGCAAYAAVITILVATLLFVGCKTQYVPVETVHEYVHHHTDTVHRTDTVTNTKETVIREATKADSALLAQYGIQLRDNERMLLFLQRELEKEKSKEVEHATDTVIKVDSIQVPYPVEKKLGAWEQVKIGSVGFVAALGIGGIVGAALWIRRRYKRC